MLLRKKKRDSLSVTPEKSVSEYGLSGKFKGFLPKVLCVLLFSQALCIILLRYIEHAPRIGPLPALADFGFDTLQFRAQQILGPSLDGTFTFSLYAFYAGPFYVWSMVVGGALGSSILGPEWYYYSGYVFTTLLCLVAISWSLRQVQKYLKGYWAVSLGVGVLATCTFTSAVLAGGGFLPYLFTPAWGPSASNAMLIAAFFSFFVYALTRQAGGAVVLFGGLAVQIHGAAELPVAAMIVFILFDVVRESQGRDLYERVLELRWVLAGAVFGWAAVLVNVIKKGFGVLLPTSQLVGNDDSAVERLHAASYNIGFGGDWVSLWFPAIVFLLAIVLGVFRREYIRISFVLCVMSLYIVAQLALFHQPDAGAHAAVWYLDIVFILIFALSIGFVCWLLGRIVGTGGGNWGLAAGATLALIIAVNPFGRPWIPLDPNHNAMSAQNAEAMQTIVRGLPAGDLNFVATSDNWNATAAVTAAASVLGHRVCRVLADNGFGEPAEVVASFTCPEGVFNDGSWLILTEEPNHVTPSNPETRLLSTAKIDIFNWRLWQYINPPRLSAGSK